MFFIRRNYAIMFSSTKIDEMSQSIELVFRINDSKRLLGKRFIGGTLDIKNSLI
jgi:hypothetical protein